MVLKLFYAFLILLTGYLGFQAYELFMAKRALTRVAPEFIIGPKDADLIMSEFLDYSCPYCREYHPLVMEAIRQDGKVAYAPRPMLSLDPDGTSAVYIFHAAAKQGKTEEAHNYLMTTGSNYTVETVPQIAADLGIDAEQLQKDLNGPETKKAAERNIRHARKLGVYATPTFMIGPDLFYVPEDEAPTIDDFLSLFAEARAIAKGEAPAPQPPSEPAPTE